MNGPGVVGAPVTLGDVYVRPGDVIVGDADGVVVVPYEHLELVLDRLRQVREAEARTEKLVRDGAIMLPNPMRVIAEATIVDHTPPG